MNQLYKDISIVTIISDAAIYEKWLDESSLQQKDINIEIIPVMNINNSKFNSARDALNYGASQSHGKYILFAHQDIKFLSDDVIRTIYDYAESIEDFGVIGVAGSKGNTKSHNILTTIVQGDKGYKVGTMINKPTEVMTVDECLFLIKREVWEGHHFSNKSGWHLYAVEYCLEMLDENKKNFVIPAQIWHKSDGVSLNYLYCDQLYELLNKYKNKYKYINTTVKTWPTSFWGRDVYLPYYRVKQQIKHVAFRKLRTVQDRK